MPTETTICRGCGASDSYFDFQCTQCGLSLIPWSLERCKGTKLNGKKCNHPVSIAALKCPICKTPRDRSFIGFMFNIYLTLTAPFLQTPTDRKSVLEQTVLYLGVVLGISLGHYIQGNQPKIEGFTDFIAACGIAFIVIPSVFRGDAINPEAPFIARFGLAVQRGAFSDLVIAAARKSL